MGLNEAIKEAVDTMQNVHEAEVAQLKQEVDEWHARYDEAMECYRAAATQRDSELRTSCDRKRLLVDAYRERDKATEFIDHIAELIACDTEMCDIADEFVAWRKGVWPIERPEPWYYVMVVGKQGDEPEVVNRFREHDLARHTVDVVLSRAEAYEAWVKEVY